MRAYRSIPERREKHNAQTREWKRNYRANGDGKTKDKAYRFQLAGYPNFSIPPQGVFIIRE